MNRFATLVLLSLTCYVGVQLTGCNSVQVPENSTATTTPTTTSTPSSTSTSSPSAPKTTSASVAQSPTLQPSAKPSPTTSPAARPPLTEQKLKNAEYYFLAKGPIKLTNGTYTDQETKRNYTMSDVVAYGDVNKDQIKDAVTTLTVTIPNQGNFSYLVALVNEAGMPKNVSTEFMGPGIKVKTLKINPDNSIEAVMDQYQAGDPECCPSLKITRTYKLKSNQAQSASPAVPKK